MIGRVPYLLCCLLATLQSKGANGFQSTFRGDSPVALSKLSVSTTSNSVSTDGDSTDESSPSKSLIRDVDFKAYGKGYGTVFSEIPYSDCEPSYGKIPTDLKGSYFRSGPGKGIWDQRRSILIIRGILDVF